MFNFLLPFTLLLVGLLCAESHWNRGWANTADLSGDFESIRDKVFEVNGFLTTSAGISDTRDTVTAAGVYEPTYDTIGDKVNFASDAVAGLQFYFPLQDYLSGTIQLLAQGKAGKDYTVKAGWAYVKWEPHQNFNVLLGRVRSPTFLFSDFVNVGYAYPWVKPPAELYSRAVSNISGILMTISETFWEEWLCELQPILAAENDTISLSGIDVSTKLRNLWGAVGKLSNDWFTLQSSYFVTKLNFEGLEYIIRETPLNIAINDGFMAASLQNAALANTYLALGKSLLPELYKIQERRVRYLNIGAQIKYKNFWVVGEWNYQRIIDSIIGGSVTQYVAFGYQYKNFLPNFTIASIRTIKTGDLLKPGDTLYQQLVGSFGASAAAQLRDGANELTKSLFQQDQWSMIFGLRYDINANVAVKCSRTVVRLRKNSKGIFSIKPPKNLVNITNFSVDLVF